MGFGYWQIVAGCFTLSLLTAIIFEILSSRYLRHVHWAITTLVLNTLLWIAYIIYYLLPALDFDSSYMAMYVEEMKNELFALIPLYLPLSFLLTALVRWLKHRPKHALPQ